MYSKEELKQLNKDFWEGFGLFCENLPRFKYRKKRWVLYNTKIKGVEMKFDATREGAFVILEFNHPNENKRLEMMTLMEQYKVIFESYFPDATWEILYTKVCGTPVSRIYKHRADLNIHRKEQWGEFFRFLSTEMNQLEKAFNELKEFLRDIAYGDS
jgi:hypothetical protein